MRTYRHPRYRFAAITWCAHHGPHFYFKGRHLAVVVSRFWEGLSFTGGDHWYLRLGYIMLTNSEG